MISRKKINKIIIVFILVVFLLITALSAIVPYLGKDTAVPATGENLSGDVAIQTGMELSGIVATGTN